MHIVFISIECPFDPSKGGGIASYLRALIPELIQNGHRVTLICNKHAGSELTTPIENLHVLHIKLPGFHWYLSKFGPVFKPFVLPLRQIEWSLKFYWTLRKILRSDPVDIIEAGELGALFIALSTKIPLVIRSHGSDYVFRKYTNEKMTLGSVWNNRIEKVILNHASRVTTPSEFQSNEIARQMGWQRGRIITIPNPVSQAILDETSCIDVISRRSRKNPVVLYAGRLARVKGVEPLLRAVPMVRKSIPNSRFVLAGEWQMPEAPRHWGLDCENIKKSVSRGILWLGYISPTHMGKWYGRASLFVMPSYYETLGISCLEAMAFGLPVVATSAGGLPEVVENGVTGILVSPGDSQALALATIKLLQDPDSCRRMGKAGRERVLTKFSAEQVTEATLTLYQKLINFS